MYDEIIKALEKTSPQLFLLKRKVQRMYYLKLVLLEVLAVAIIVFLYGRINGVDILGAIFAISIPILLKPWKCFGKGYIGVIESVSYTERRIPVKGDVSGYQTSMKNVQFIECTLKKENENFVVLEFDRKFEKVYKKGAVLLFLPWIKNPICLGENIHTACPFCGNIMPGENKKCVGCGEELPRC